MTRCRDHYNKMIFVSVDHANLFMHVFYPEQIYRAYPCPSGRSHFHILNKSKRNRRHRKNKERNRKLRKENEKEDVLSVMLS